MPTASGGMEPGIDVIGAGLGGTDADGATGERT